MTFLLPPGIKGLIVKIKAKISYWTWITEKVSRVEYFILLWRGCFGTCEGSQHEISLTFTGKHLCWNLFLIKWQTWRPTTLLQRDSQHKCFPVNIVYFLRTLPLLVSEYPEATWNSADLGKIMTKGCRGKLWNYKITQIPQFV